MVKLCNKKNCQSICHINAAKKPFAKCLKHLNDGKRLSEQKFRKRLETLDESGVLSKARGLKVKGLTALRMRKLRSDRKAVIFSIESENIRRLATKLNLVRGGLRYVVIQDAIPQSVTLGAIKTRGRISPITFSCSPPYLRTMRNVSNSLDIMPDLLEAIKIVFPDCLTIKVKLLHSEAGDTAQLTPI